MLAKVHKMRVALFFSLIVLILDIQAQSPSGSAGFNSDIFSELEKSERGEGVVNIEQSERMRQLVLTHIRMNKRAGGAEGFRVQLYSGSGSMARQEALEVKGKLLSELPDGNVFVEYTAPFWRVRMGNFRHKHDALPLLNQLKAAFSSCYIVKVNEIPLNSLE